MFRRFSGPGLIVALIAAVVLVLTRGEAEPGGGQERSARVVRVVDGDTIVVQLGGREERVRYLGIDTPESVKPNTPVQCFARQASAANARLVDGRRVRLVADVEPRDRYGRLLAYVYREPDGLFVNEELVRQGFATSSPYPPNVRYEARFRAAAAEARKGRQGLWRAC